MWCWDHVGCELCVTQLPEISRFLADEGLLILNWFCLWVYRICRHKKRSFKSAYFLPNILRNHLFSCWASNSLVRGVRFLFCRTYNSVDVLVKSRYIGPCCWLSLDFHWSHPCYEPNWYGDYSEKYKFSLWRDVFRVSREKIHWDLIFVLCYNALTLSIWRARKVHVW